MDEKEPNSASIEAPTKDQQALGTTFRQFRLIFKAFFASERRHKARGFLLALLMLALSVGGVQILMSYAGRDFMTAITRKNSAAYWSALGWYLGSFALAVPIGVYYRWVEEQLALLWREWMAQHLVKRYFNNRAYFRLRGSESVDNPDQRISEDVRNFTTSSLSFLLILLNSLVTLVAFIGVLWMISGTLVVMLVVYAIAGTAISIAIGRKLVRLHYHQYEKEANFRYGLVRVRDNAESIAFYRGEKREHLDLINRLAAAVGNMRLVIIRNRKLGFFTNSYNYLALVLPLLVVAPMFMRGQVEFGVVTQAAGAFAQVLAAFSLIITQFGGLSDYLAGVQRLGSLWDQLDEHDNEEERIASVNLSEVFARVDDDLDRVLDWSNVLSLGEQQRIAFARLFLRKPKFAFLDEATSALDEQNQQDLYQQIRDSGIGFISVGHRETSIQHHDLLLKLDRSGSWKIENAKALPKPGSS